MKVGKEGDNMVKNLLGWHFISFSLELPNIKLGYVVGDAVVWHLGTWWEPGLVSPSPGGWIPWPLLGYKVTEVRSPSHRPLRESRSNNQGGWGAFTLRSFVKHCISCILWERSSSFKNGRHTRRNRTKGLVEMVRLVFVAEWESKPSKSSILRVKCVPNWSFRHKV